ncbi:hypothetical protein AWM79_05745 [Pseudomonas agarici]|uniref:Uncharacterized protein n=1 Tax=Pseudomonas agarici TaxID=46677 RepID=A0A0X1SYC0_PSEAA|nr:hypothetical protein [Pseudomonas agarici]AMB84836.1 hypothetical protein AWM79_05745 [Pseudomonas agarici]
MIRTISFSYYPRVFLSGDFISEVVGFFANQTDRSVAAQALGLLDEFLDIARLDISALKDPMFIAAFWGFLLVETNATDVYAWILVSKVRKVGHLIGLNVEDFKIVCGSKLKNKCKEYYRSLRVSRERINYYQGWWLSYPDKKPIFVYLSAVYDQFGKGVCDEFYRRIRDHVTKYPYISAMSVNRSVSMLLKSLTKAFKDKFELDLVQDPIEMHAFFEHAHALEQKRRLNQGLDMKAFSRDWSAMMRVVEDVFITHELFPAKLYDFAFEEYVGVVDGNPFAKGGSINLVSLITAMPSHISDESAAKRLYDKINTDVDTIVQACEEARLETLEAFRRQQAAAVNCSNEELFANATEKEKQYMLLCKKWTDNVYFTLDDYKFEKFYGVKKAEASRELKLLDSVTLLPFIYLLINEVPAITKSWLLGHKYTDKYNQKFGFNDELNSATGLKPRRGAADAEQTLRLTAKARVLLSEIYELTGEARAWLQAHNDPAARYTLLSSSTGLASPTRLGKISGMSAQKNCTSLLAEKISFYFGKHSKTLLRRLSLKSMRATAGVIVYFKTSSVQAMSEALGHKHYSAKLLDRYLPKVIRRYYLGRWIRTFQDGIIFESFQDSEHLLDVIGLNTLEELDEFLKHYRLKSLPGQLNLKNWLPADERNPSQILNKGIIPVEIGISTFMVCVDHVVSQLIASGHEVPEVLQNWRNTAALTRHAVELTKSGELDLVDHKVLSILSKIELSEPLVAKIHQLIGFKEAA